MQWLNENDDVSLEYLNSAFLRDKKDGVRETNYLNIMFISNITKIKNTLTENIFKDNVYFSHYIRKTSYDNQNIYFFIV